MKLIEGIKHIFQPKPSFPLILVTGIPKTGTTAVYHSIREQLPAGSVCLFEPENRKLELPDVISSPVLVKSFVPVSTKYDHFNKKIMIIRDPRDNMISRILYCPFNIAKGIAGKPSQGNSKILEQLIDLLEKKEKDPHSVRLIDLYLPLKEFISLEPYRLLLDYHSVHPGIFTFRYEDYIDNNFDAINKHLGLNIKPAERVPEKRVVRSKAYGNWKDWFTEEDIEYFREIFEPFMTKFGYNNDWTLNKEQKIDPALGSVYVRNLIKEAGS